MKNLKYPHLFQPLKVGNILFKNRILLSPTMMSQFDKGGYPNQQTISYYEGKAKGGAALVTIGETAVDLDRAPSHPGHLNIFDVGGMHCMAQLIDAVHQHDCKISIELCHGGHESPPEIIGKNPFGPSAMVKPDGTVVDEMTKEDIKNVVNAFATTAAWCQKVGFDMVMLHGGHGWLLSQFTSPYANKRTDEYGGSLENRARFAIEVIEAIKARCGKGFPIEYRVSGSELTEGGLTLEDTIAFLKMIEDKVDLIHVSAGIRADAHTRAIMHPSAFLGHGPNVYLAEAIKKEITKCPIVTIGAISDPAIAEELIASGTVDFVSMCRTTIADPDWPNKCRKGQEDDITPCIKCFYCLDGEKVARRFGCSVNPTAGRNMRLDALTKPATKCRKVLVIGGGPAGMQCAKTCAERGHDVTLVEKSDALGGQLKYGTHEYFKDGLLNFMNYLIRQVNKLGVKVLLNTEATPEWVSDQCFDVVVAATGATPIIPPIPGADSPKVYNAFNYFENLENLGQRVVIVGGGLVGCEGGLDLAQTYGKQVTILEMGDAVAPDAWRTHRIPLTERLDEFTDVRTGARVTNIADNAVTYVDGEGVEHLVECDSVILAVGMRPNAEDAEQFRYTAEEDYVQIGDCVKIQTVYGATHTGYWAALDI